MATAVCAARSPNVRVNDRNTDAFSSTHFLSFSPCEHTHTHTRARARARVIAPHCHQPELRPSLYEMRVADDEVDDDEYGRRSSERRLFLRSRTRTLPSQARNNH